MNPQIPILIEQHCDALKKLLLAKNSDYGSSFAKSPVLCPKARPQSAILVRMSDKINRIANLTTIDKTEVNETINETMVDLAGYCILFNVLSDKFMVQ